MAFWDCMRSRLADSGLPDPRDLGWDDVWDAIGALKGLVGLHGKAVTVGQLIKSGDLGAISDVYESVKIVYYGSYLATTAVICGGAEIADEVVDALNDAKDWFDAQFEGEVEMSAPNIDLETHEETSTSYQWSEKEELLLPFPGRDTSEDCYEQEDTEIIQRQLGKHGFHVTVDGKFGDKTRQAVYDFQTQKGIVNDGIVGANTWSALFFYKV